MPPSTSIFLPYQRRWLDDKSPLKLMEKSRQVGMSWTSAFALVKENAESAAAYDTWVSSRDELQAELFIQDCANFATILHEAADRFDRALLDDLRPCLARSLKFKNGRCIHALSSNPNAQAGKRGTRLLDEFALHPNPRELYAIALPGITWGGRLEIISTHRGAGNFFNELVTEITQRGNPKKFSHHKVTLMDALTEGFLTKLKTKLPDSDPRAHMNEDKYYDYIRSQCADEASFRQEYMCDPSFDEASFLPLSLILSAQFDSQNSPETQNNISSNFSGTSTNILGNSSSQTQNTNFSNFSGNSNQTQNTNSSSLSGNSNQTQKHSENSNNNSGDSQKLSENNLSSDLSNSRYSCTPGSLVEDPECEGCQARSRRASTTQENPATPLPINVTCPLSLGVDLGRTHDRTVIFVLEKIGDTLFTRDILRLQNAPFAEQEAALDRWASHPLCRSIAIDASGLGRQFSERAERRYGSHRVEAVVFTDERKAQLAYQLKDAFERRRVRIPDSRELRDDLMSVEKSYSVSGTLRFHAPRDAAGHADHFWALALAISSANRFTAAPAHIEIPIIERKNRNFL